jgi:hypothetical protein
MQCERLIKLAKSWYLSVRDETMAPARMISFIEQHVAHCGVCQVDPDIRDEIAKITEIILPEAKLPKAIRLNSEHDDDEELEDEDVDLSEVSDEEEEEEEELEGLDELDELDEEPLLDEDDEI